MLITGTLLYVSKPKKSGEPVDYVDAILIGVAQGISIIPGLSRSGATISTGFMRGIDKRKVFDFSFLLSIPAILIATIAESSELPSLLLNIEDLYPVLAGLIAAMVVGFISLKILQRIILEEKLHYFSPYCWAAGTLVVLSQILIQ